MLINNDVLHYNKDVNTLDALGFTCVAQLVIIPVSFNIRSCRSLSKDVY